jgi:hypothetical protein
MMTSAAIDLLATLLAHGAADKPGCVHPELSEFAARLHLQAIDHMHAASETLNAMLRAVASEPLNDDNFDELDLVLARQLKAAGHAMLQFRERRECEGNA